MLIVLVKRFVFKVNVMNQGVINLRIVRRVHNSVLTLNVRKIFVRRLSHLNAQQPSFVVRLMVNALVFVLVFSVLKWKNALMEVARLIHAQALAVKVPIFALKVNVKKPDAKKKTLVNMVVFVAVISIFAKQIRALA